MHKTRFQGVEIVLKYGVCTERENVVVLRFNFVVNNVCCVCNFFVCYVICFAFVQGLTKPRVAVSLGRTNFAQVVILPVTGT